MNIIINKTLKLTALLVLLTFALGMMPASPEEGMYPLSEIHKVDLVKAGLKIDPKDLYNPDGISLIDALVNIGGCTGSFVSDNGLIITNHHCAFGAIAGNSTVENNYLENGFHAKSFAEELPAPQNSCRITESYEDVSDKILDAIKNIQDPAQRVQTISAKMKELSDAATNEKESIVAEVSEMFAGKSYVLFKYRTVRDVRLVYAPPQSIGNFGGESDNWVWPRHTGDFSFMRAYVSPEGKSVPYSKDNVPYKPKKFLKVNPNGVEEGDFVFILGYPGRTFRHRPSHYIKYQQDYLLPYIANLYNYGIETMQKLGKDDKSLELSFASRIKGLANTMKNYQGKLRGLNRLNLVDNKVKEEKEILQFINNSPELKAKYGNLFSRIGEIFNSINETALADLWVRQINSISTSVSVASFILNYAQEIQKPDSERLPAYQEKNISRTKSMIARISSSHNREFEKMMLYKMIKDASAFDDNSKIAAVDDLIGSNGSLEESVLNEFIDEVLNENITDPIVFEEYLNKKPEEVINLNSSLFNFSRKVIQQQKALNKENERNEGTLNKLYGDLVDIKILWKNTNFIPDANSTLRLTYGYIKGYNPVDALYSEPFTSIDGILEKNALNENDDFAIPDKLRTLYNDRDLGNYISKKTKKLPVAMLYNMDTTGGNSGSPVMDAFGNLIGVNFDRAFEATINDYAWNESYSRSIGVDIRYVLWVLDKFSGAKNLLNEMKI